MIRFFISKFAAVFKNAFLICSGILLFWQGVLTAQTLPDSLARRLKNDSLHIYRKTTAKLFLKAENRFSFVSQEGINLYGVMAGATFHELHTFFLGYYTLDPRNKEPLSPAGLGKDIRHYLDLRYGVLGYQYMVHKSRFWQVNTPLALGYGSYHVERKNTDGTVLSSSQGHIYPTSAGLQVIFKPVHWVGVSVSGGYRYIAQQENTELSLRGFYYAFGIWFDGRFISRKLQYKQKKRHYQKILRQSVS